MSATTHFYDGLSTSTRSVLCGKPVFNSVTRLANSLRTGPSSLSNGCTICPLESTCQVELSSSPSDQPFSHQMGSGAGWHMFQTNDHPHTSLFEVERGTRFRGPRSQSSRASFHSRFRMEYQLGHGQREDSRPFGVCISRFSLCHFCSNPMPPPNTQSSGEGHLRLQGRLT
jgi:hypothetical protein